MGIWKSYQSMILTIIEDKPRYEIPIAVYKGIIIISFLQIVVSLFQDFQLNHQDDLKLQSVFQISKMVSVVNILNLRSSDTLSFAIYIIAMSFMYIFFIYIGLLSLAYVYMKEQVQIFQNAIAKINELFNLYFTFYLNAFLTVYLELNFSLILCSAKSLLTDQRSQYNDNTINTCTIPNYQLVLGVIGLIFTILTAFMTNYYFRNYEFLETNALKRKSSILYSVLILIRMILSLLDFQAETDATIQARHILAQVYGIVSVYDYFNSLPFTNQHISQFYLNFIAYYYSVVISSHLFFLSHTINGQEMFYMSILISLVLRAAIQQALLYRYNSIMQGGWKLETLIPQLDYYMEQIVLLGQNSSFREEDKVIIQKSYQLHRNSCLIKTCLCHKHPKLNMRMQSQEYLLSNEDEELVKEKDMLDKEINMELLYKFIDGLFQWMFSQKCMNKSNSYFEILSLKYVSFIIKYQNNPIRAYYELKVLQQKKITFSIYFDLISQIIGKSIESKIEEKFENQLNLGVQIPGSEQGFSRKSKQSRSKVSMHNELSVQSIIDVEQLSQQFVPIFLQIIDQKLELWTNLQSGYQSMNGLQKDSLKLMKQINKTRRRFTKEVKSIMHLIPEVDNFIQFQKLIQIYYLFILNDTIQVITLEMKINELRKRDTTSDYHKLQNISLLKGDICNLEVSLSENFGKIISTKNEKTAHFFGYKKKQDFQKINHINDLIPNYVGRVHNQLIRKYLQGISIRSKNGNTPIHSFMKQNDGFIFPVMIHFDFNFNISTSDFKCNGILLKNQVESEFIVFHRSGKIQGITKNLANLLYGNTSKLPSGDNVIQNMNVLLLFPKIIKIITSHRDQIIKDIKKKVFQETQSQGDTSRISSTSLKSASSMNFLLQDKKSSTRFSKNPKSNLRRFTNFLNKKSKMGGEYINYNEIDILDSQCLVLLKQFEEQDFEGYSTNRSNLSSERFKSAKGESIQNGLNQFSKYTTFSSKSSKFNQNSMEHKIKFDYNLQYCLLDNNSNSNNNELQNKQKEITYKNKQNGYKIKQQDSFKDIYFCLELENIAMSLKQKKTKQKNNDSFFSNIITYLRSTTSIIPLSQNIEKLTFSKQGYSQIIDSNENLKMDSQQNLKYSNMSTQIIDNLATPLSISALDELVYLPKKMIKALQSTYLYSSNLDDDENIRVKGNQNKLLSNQDNNLNKRSELSSQKSNNSDSNSSDSSDDINYEKMHTQVINQIYGDKTHKETKSNKEAKDAQCIQLDATMNHYCAQKNILNQIDPNYPLKKILQKRSLSSNFSRALELAVSEALVQIQIEKNVQNRNQYQNQQLKKISYKQTLKKDIVQPMTFRQEIRSSSVINMSLEKNISSSEFKYESGLNTDNQLNQVQKDYQSQNLLEASYYLEQNKEPNELDNSNRASFQNIETSHALGTSFISNTPMQYTTRINVIDDQNQTYLNVSTMPMLNNTNNNTSDFQYIPTNTPSIQNHAKINQTTQNIRFNNNNKNNNNNKSKIKIQEEQRYIQNQQISQNFYQRSHNDDDVPNQILNIQALEQVKRYTNVNNFSDKNSNEKNDGGNNDKEQDLICENAIAKILNQKGMINDKNTIQKASVHSSSRQSTYAGLFLKEIIFRSKTPLAAKRYQMLLAILLISFVSLNVIILVIMKSDMNVFSDNVTILRQPRKFLRAYGKALFGYYLQIQMDMGYLFDTKDDKYLDTSNDYISRGSEEYNTLCESDSGVLVRLGLEQAQSNDTSDQTYYVYKNRQQSEFNITKALMYSQHQYYLISLMRDQHQNSGIDSFLYLRQNYFSFSSNVIEQVDYLVKQTISAVDSLIYKFTIIIICTIFSLIILALISLPIIRQINFYEEKIMMVVTNINFDQAETEKCRLSICKELINIDSIDWLNYSYFDISNMALQSNNNQQHHQTSKSKLKAKNQGHATSSNSSMSNNNYLLQSKMAAQKLRIFDRFLTIFFLTFFNCAYFLVVIIYLTGSNDQLKIPVQMNQRSIQLHIIQTNLKISCELLAFDAYIKDELWSDYSIEDLSFYYDSINNSIDQIKIITDANTNIIYGSNPFPSATVGILKDIQEGRGCKYLTIYKCDPGQELGLRTINSSKEKFITGYPNILNPTKSDRNQLLEYLNGDSYAQELIISFKGEDEIYDVYSTIINESISTVSLQIIQFLQNYLIIAGVLYSFIILLTEIINWRRMQTRIQQMNLLLTIIPEEKLQEDATLHMIRQIHRM